MAKICPNDSVGVIIKKDGKYAVIKRKNYPVAYAFVAGHLDGADPETQARAEAEEEVSAKVSSLASRIENLDLQNPCKRENGTHHVWWVYEADVPGATLKAGSDAAEAFWLSRNEIVALMERTRNFAERHGVRLDDLAVSTPAIVKDPEWEADPGFEPVWTVLLDKIAF